MRIGLIIVAAGSSSRMGGTDKLWQLLGDRPVIHHCLDRLAPLADQVVVAVRADSMRRAEGDLSGRYVRPTVVAGGSERQESVYRALMPLADADVIVVHDAARPFAPPQLVQEGLKLLATCEGAVPAYPLADTIKRVDQDGGVIATIDRAQLRAAQTPQIFQADALRTAHERMRRSDVLATDDASLLELCGYTVKVFAGDPGNFKITTDHDLQMAQLIARQEGSG